MSRTPVFGLIFFLLFTLHSTGQEKTERAGHAHKRTAIATRGAKKHKTNTKSGHSKKGKNLHKKTNKPVKKTVHTSHHPKKETKPKAPPAGKSRGGAYSGSGFRVQIYNGTDRGKALMIRDQFEKHYPGVCTYLSYIAPHYRVKVGDYKRRQDAMGMYREASSSYFPCMIVPDKVVIK